MTQKSLLLKGSQKLEKGQVLSISDDLIITEDYTVTYYGIPVGSVKENLSWFSLDSPHVRYDEIKEIVYLGNYKWGVKQLTLPRIEFESLDDSSKDKVLEDLLTAQANLWELDEKTYY